VEKTGTGAIWGGPGRFGGSPTSPRLIWPVGGQSVGEGGRRRGEKKGGGNLTTSYTATCARTPPKMGCEGGGNLTASYTATCEVLPPPSKKAIKRVGGCVSLCLTGTYGAFFATSPTLAAFLFPFSSPLPSPYPSLYPPLFFSPFNRVKGYGGWGKPS